MRTIRKSQSPQELIRWKSENADIPENLKYGRADFPSDALRNSLLLEQYHLCAYTMRSLKTKTECEAEGLTTASSCHVEHFLPQSRKAPNEDIDYQNMLACYPPSQSKTACHYCAHAKDDFDPKNGNFISPLDTNAENHFYFDRRGNIESDTDAGKNTIKILNLNHQTLVNDRAATIKGFLQPRGKEISARQAKRIAEQIMQADAQKKLSAYCVAISQTAVQYADRKEQRSARMR